MNRRVMLMGIGTISVLPRSIAASPSSGESQLIGLSIDDVSANWGDLGEPIDRNDLSPFPMYQTGSQTWMIHIAFQPTADMEIATFAQFDTVSDEGVDWVDANQLVTMILPPDSVFTESYTMQATPDGPLELAISRYTSESTAEALGNQSQENILAIIANVYQPENENMPRAVRSVMISTSNIPQ